MDGCPPPVFARVPTCAPAAPPPLTPPPPAAAVAVVSFTVPPAPAPADAVVSVTVPPAPTLGVDAWLEAALATEPIYRLRPSPSFHSPSRRRLHRLTRWSRSPCHRHPRWV